MLSAVQTRFIASLLSFTIRFYKYRRDLSHLYIMQNRNYGMHYPQFYPQYRRDLSRLFHTIQFDFTNIDAIYRVSFIRYNSISQIQTRFIASLLSFTILFYKYRRDKSHFYHSHQFYNAQIDAMNRISTIPINFITHK